MIQIAKLIHNHKYAPVYPRLSLYTYFVYFFFIISVQLFNYYSNAITDICDILRYDMRMNESMHSFIYVSLKVIAITIVFILFVLVNTQLKDSIHCYITNIKID